MPQTKTVKQTNKQLNKILQYPEFYDKLDNINIMEAQKTKNVVKAFNASMIKNYNPIPKDWENDDRKMTVPEAVKKVSSEMSPNTFKKYVSLNYFRQDQNGLLYRDEIEKYVSAISIIDILFKDILQIENEIGSKRIVLYPIQNPHEGVFKHDQRVRAMFYTIKQPWLQDWMNAVDLE